MKDTANNNIVKLKIIILLFFFLFFFFHSITYNKYIILDFSIQEINYVCQTFVNSIVNNYFLEYSKNRDRECDT